MASQKTIVISVDVEGIPLRNGSTDYSSIEEGLPTLLELFKEFSVHSTLFVTHDALEKNSELLREALERGHEIGCHGYMQSTPSRQYAGIKEDTKQMIRLLSVRPTGFRAHHFRINAQILRSLIRLGYKYDSSVISPSSILHRRQFRNTPKTPYKPDLDNIYAEGDSPILEIPVSALPVVNLPLALSFMKLCGLRLYKTLLLSANQSLLILYLHPYDLFSLPSGVVKVPFYFRIFHRIGEGVRVLREALEFFEEALSPKYVCAKEVAAQCAFDEASSTPV